VWELLWEGRWVKAERPYLRVPKGYIAVKVKAFLLDDYSAWAASKGLKSVSRWAFGNVVGGTGAKTGEYVVAFAENAAADYVASRLYFAAPPSPASLTLVHSALVHAALDLLPRYAKVQVSGRDPRLAYIQSVADIGPSRYSIILQGGVLRSGARAVALTRLFEVAGPGLVRVLDVPGRRYIGIAKPLDLARKGLDEARPGEWAIVLIE
jgi:hypothetical protein